MKYAQKAESELQDRQESSLKIESEIWILKALEDKFDSYGITNERMNEHRLAFLELLAEQKNKENGLIFILLFSEQLMKYTPRLRRFSSLSSSRTVSL